MVKRGDRFWDERNNRYLTADAVGTNPKVWYCLITVAKKNKNGSDYHTLVGNTYIRANDLEALPRR